MLHHRVSSETADACSNPLAIPEHSGHPLSIGGGKIGVDKANNPDPVGNGQIAQSLKPAHGHGLATKERCVLAQCIPALAATSGRKRLRYQPLFSLPERRSHNFRQRRLGKLAVSAYDDIR